MTIHDAFRDQARSCSALGSPFMRRFCTLIADRLNGDGPVGQKMLDWPGSIGAHGQSVPLRFAGALHALARMDRQPALSAVYPPHHQTVTDDALWAAISAVMRDEASFILEWMRSAPQTNEVQRSNALLPGFLSIADRFGQPLVLSEIGASMGLNLRWDKYYYQLGEAFWGNAEAPVSMAPEWTGPLPPLASARVIARAGCDLAPLDPADPADRHRLLSYCWPDQIERLARTSAAMDNAAADGIKIVRQDAIAWLRDRLAQPWPGCTHVIYHSVAWQYFPPDLQAEGLALIEAAGARASKDRPLAWLQVETDGQAPGAAITLRLWPDGSEQVLGRADFHGRWVNWTGWS